MTPVPGNPTGGQVAAGSASITNAGSTLTINQGSNAAIINWQSFSINSGELTKFIVPNSSSATLNRVLGGNVSAIYGTLQSNGKFFLVNPSGIVVGASGRIDTAGFLGSTLNVSDDEFLKGGDLHFTGTSGAGIDNQGVIHAESGDVYLIANQVNNSGTLSAPQGNVGMAAGSSILLQRAGDQHLFVQPNVSTVTQTTGVTNSGAIEAATAELKAAGGNAYALAINNTGNIVATGFKKVNGQVYLTADGGDITNSGEISAQNPNGDGGTIVLNGHGTSSAGTVLNSGKLIASGQTKGAEGGTVQVLGNRVGIIDHGVVDISGDAGGGTALIGGDEQGTNPAILDADQTYVGPDAQVIADALATGDGGKIILWGDVSTQAYGQLSARGGSLSGNGGFVETSAPTLDVQTAPNVSAPHGMAGTWLLDPSDILISDNVTTTPGFSAPFMITSGSTFDLNQSDLLTALVNGNVTLDASGGSGGNGTIIWQQPNGTALDVSNIAGHTLTLDAPAQFTNTSMTQIVLSGVVIQSINGGGSLNLAFNSASPSNASNVQILNSNIQLNGGSMTAYGTGFMDTTQSTSFGNFDGIYISNSNLALAGGNLVLNGTAGYYFNNDPSINAVSAGFGIDVEHSTITTTGTGTVSMTGNGGITTPLVTSATSMIGVEVSNATVIGTDQGNTSITGTVNSGNGVGNSAGIVGVDISGGSNITTTKITGAPSAGGITLNGNTTGSTATDNSNVGVRVAGTSTNLSTISAGTGGNISITGNAGNITADVTGFTNGGGETAGIQLSNGATFTGIASDSITLNGTAGADTSPGAPQSSANSTDSTGVSIQSNNTGFTTPIAITTSTGDISITGTGGTSLTSIEGVQISGGTSPALTTITSGTGNITINGSTPNNAGAITQSLVAVDLNKGSEVLTGAGSISMTGNVLGGSAGNGETGIGITQSAVVEATTGGVTLNGNSSASSATLSGGVAIFDTGTQVLAGGGTGLQITGSSGTINGSTGAIINTVLFNPTSTGVFIANGASVGTIGSAPITLHGTGNTNSNTDPVSSSTGVSIVNGANLTSTGAGNISITGTAGSSPTAGIGVVIEKTASLVTVSTTGQISVTGTAGGGNTGGTSIPSTGVSIDSVVTLDGQGITLTGTGNGPGALGPSSLAPGIYVGDNSTGSFPTLNAGTGVLSFISNVNGGVNASGAFTAGSTSVQAGGFGVEIFNIGAGSLGAINLTAANTVLYQLGSIDLGNVSAGNLTILTPGNVTQSAPINVTLLQGVAGGSITLANPANSIPQLGQISRGGAVNIVTSGGIALNNSINANSASFTLTIDGIPFSLDLNSGGTLPAPFGDTLPAIATNLATPVTVQALGGNVMLGPLASFASTNAGNNFTFVAANNFVNNATLGASVFNTTGGASWLVYSTSPTLDTTGGLTPSLIQYNITYPSLGTLPAGSTGLFYSGSNPSGTGGSGGTGGSSPSSPPNGSGDVGGGTTTGQQVATVLPVDNQVDPNPPTFSTTLLVVDISSLGADISYNPQGSTSPIFENVSLLAGASSGDSDVGPDDVVKVGGGTVTSAKAPPAVTGILNGALNNQVKQDLYNALHGH
ncbi:MAG: filamentous hemagglutinin N-terminal domain-containing protein [Methylacidiphilales bacterium]|nr:filamentous hemagglutinin N-terminal domain-containing protein [Candidatus Methylacidiphilales bacterium]